MNINFCEYCGSKLEEFPTGSGYYDCETGIYKEQVEITCPIAYKMSIWERIKTKHYKDQAWDGGVRCKLLSIREKK